MTDMVPKEYAYKSVNGETKRENFIKNVLGKEPLHVDTSR